MGKAKVKAVKGPQQRHLYSRMSFLYQATRYLSSVSQPREPRQQPNAQGDSKPKSADQASAGETSNPVNPKYSECNEHAEVSKESLSTKICTGLPRLYATQLRAISRKSTIRLTPEVKRSICKRCDSLLEPAFACTTYIENNSRNGHKPWADVLVTKCNECGCVKRFPVGIHRQQRKQQRKRSLGGREATKGHPDSSRSKQWTVEFARRTSSRFGPWEE